MNPYYEEWGELQEDTTFRGEQWFSTREELIDKYAWAVPNDEATLYLSEFQHIVEVGAGSGYWAKCINDVGGTVIPYDSSPPDDMWTEVHQRDVQEMPPKLFDNPILLVWPPLDEGVATQVSEQRPPHILYVGEQRGGCTAEDSFFDIIESEYGVAGKLDIPSFAGVHDELFHYIRKV